MMNLKDTVQVFCSPGKGLTKDMITLEWSQDYNMKHHSSFHQFIEKVWVNKSKNAVRLFNASKFRLYRVEEQKKDDIVMNVKFLLGTTDYKNFIGTNCAPFAEKLVKDGVRDYCDSQAYLANPVGVGGLLETNDENLVFIRRSNICAEMPGLVDRPGGHPEPDEVIMEFNGNNNSKALDEIFDSVQKEIRDEINIPIENLSTPILLGISYNPKTWRRPSIEFYVRCHLSTKEVLALYSKQTQAESEESTDLVIVPVSKILDLDDLKSSDLYNELTHAAQSAIYCLKIFYGK